MVTVPNYQLPFITDGTTSTEPGGWGVMDNQMSVPVVVGGAYEYTTTELVDLELSGNAFSDPHNIPILVLPQWNTQYATLAYAIQAWSAICRPIPGAQGGSVNFADGATAKTGDTPA